MDSLELSRMKGGRHRASRSRGQEGPTCQLEGGCGQGPDFWVTAPGIRCVSGTELAASQLCFSLSLTAGILATGEGAGRGTS